MRDVEFTFREILVSVLIILAMIALGLFIANGIHDSATEDSEVYFKALKVDNDPDLFDYAIRTEVGDTLSYGTFKANEPVKDKLIDGEYFAIRKTEEHYTMHTRTVSYKCGKSTCTRTETYWTWDSVGTETEHTKSFNYLGADFNFDKVDFSNYKYKEKVKTEPNVRYVFDVIPKEFNGTLYAKAKDKTISKTTLFYGEKIKSVMEAKETQADRYTLIFWICWGFLIVVIVVIFAVLDNRYLNGY